jgi:hypothetical protein
MNLIKRRYFNKDEITRNSNPDLIDVSLVGLLRCYRFGNRREWEAAYKFVRNGLLALFPVGLDFEKYKVVQI